MLARISPCGRSWLRYVYVHNPLYLVSAWLVLHGVRQAFQGDVGLSHGLLMTQLLCGYTLILALAAWLVVRVGKVWEDARTILLVLLLMFTGISVSYDELCLRDPTAGLMHLAAGFAFCIVITETILYLLRIRLPIHFRVPYYLQLAVLFAFPPWLGRLSVAGHDTEMGLGVLLFPLVSAASLLTLLPAAMKSRPQGPAYGTPWPWPHYPWSIFVFFAVAMAIRAWMLSLSFSPAYYADPAFLPYFLCPILLAMLILALELGLRHRSRLTQQLSLVAMLAVIGLAFPGDRLNSAAQFLVDILEASYAGPPMIVAVSVAVLGFYAMLRKAAGAELVAFSAIALTVCLDADTRSARDMSVPSDAVLLALASWQLGIGLWTRTTMRLAVGGFVVLFITQKLFDTSWLAVNGAQGTVLLGLLWFVVLPLFCRDAVARWLREHGAVWGAVVTTGLFLASPGIGPPLPSWVLPATVTSLACLGVLYWARTRLRWYLVTTTWAAMLATILWIQVLLKMLPDPQIRRGLTWYVTGWLLLAAAVLVSLWKAGLLRKAWIWLQRSKPQVDGTTAVS